MSRSSFFLLHTCFFVLAFLFVAGWTAPVAWAAEDPERRIPAFTAYLEPDVGGARIDKERGVVQWKDPETRVHWFGHFPEAGRLSAALDLRLPASATPASFTLTLAGQTHHAEVSGSGTDTLVRLALGEFEIREPGYQEFLLESDKAGGGSIEALILSGPAAKAAHFNLVPRRNAASVHLAYPVDKGVEVAAFYVEMTGIEDPLWTYYMACGWHRGYFGMQVNSPTERRIIFSVWDSGNEAIDRDKVKGEDRVMLVGKGEDVYSGDFGNEGTGGHSHLKFPWKTGEKQRFLATAQPVDGTRTIFSGYYYRPDLNEWMLISSWKAPKEGGYLRGLYSFSENFAGRNGHVRRKALYGNQWILTSAGEWIELTRATFSHDATGKEDRLDRFMGVEDGQFFLSHGGFVPGRTRYGAPFDRPAVAEARSPAALGLPSLPIAKP